MATLEDLKELLATKLAEAKTPEEKRQFAGVLHQAIQAHMLRYPDSEANPVFQDLKKQLMLLTLL